MSPVEAIGRINESVTVEMLVRRTKCCAGSCQVFLDSEPNHRDPKNLGVVITVEGRPKFAQAGRRLCPRRSLRLRKRQGGWPARIRTSWNK